MDFLLQLLFLIYPNYWWARAAVSWSKTISRESFFNLMMSSKLFFWQIEIFCAICLHSVVLFCVSIFVLPWKINRVKSDHKDTLKHTLTHTNGITNTRFILCLQKRRKVIYHRSIKFFCVWENSNAPKSATRWSNNILLFVGKARKLFTSE